MYIDFLPDSIQGLFDDPEEGSEGSIQSAEGPSPGPSSPLLVPATRDRELHTGIQQLEVSNENLFESADDVLEELPSKAPSRSFVASTIMEVEEEQCEEMVDSLEPLPLNKSPVIPVAKAAMMDNNADTVSAKVCTKIMKYIYIYWRSIFISGLCLFIAFRV